MASNISNRISFIIPAYNEQNNIGITLQSIYDGELSISYEVIVVDHCSTDGTVAIAKEKNARVSRIEGGTIASVRNFGVKNSNGEIIVFLDADVSLTPQWFQSIGNTIDYLGHNPLTVTGSFCCIPNEGSWVQKYWFKNLSLQKGTNYLGTGHMIVKRDLFELINGFDESLNTGEDYAFCKEVLRYGGSIVNNPKLRVIHRDFPSNIKEFICREAWHGTGDIVSFVSVLRSKVAVATVLFFILHAAGLLILIVPALSNMLLIWPIVVLLALLLFSSKTKFGSCGFLTLLVNSALFYFYYIGRSISFIKVFGVSIEGHKRRI